MEGVKSHLAEKPTPGKEYGIKGLSGKITIEHWFTGDDDIRISVYDRKGDHVQHFTTNQAGAEKLAEGLSSKKIGETITVYLPYHDEKYSQSIGITPVGGEIYMLEADDSNPLEQRKRAFFNKDQVTEIKSVLGTNK